MQMGGKYTGFYRYRKPVGRSVAVTGQSDDRAKKILHVGGSAAVLYCIFCGDMVKYNIIQ